MDPVSQAALGAVVGQAVGHRRLGFRAAAAGALAGAAPDLDVLFAIGGDYFDQLVVHRGITHSLLFAPVVGPLAGWLAWRFERRRSLPLAATATDDHPPRLTAWMLVLTLALWSHPLLDLLTPYGTQLLQPLSDARFALRAMPIIDPVYTLTLLFGLWVAWRWRGGVRAGTVATATLILSCLYLGYGGYLNHAAEREARRQLAQAGIAAEVAAFPTILQVHHRRVVALTPQAVRVGFVSMWRPCSIRWQTVDRLTSASLSAYLASREGAIFHWFTMGWAHYRLVPERGGFVLHATDLRYGFDTDPERSIFRTTVRLDQDLAPVGQAVGGRDAPAEEESLLAGLMRDAYPSTCPDPTSILQSAD